MAFRKPKVGFILNMCKISILFNIYRCLTSFVNLNEGTIGVSNISFVETLINIDPNVLPDGITITFWSLNQLPQNQTSFFLSLIAAPPKEIIPIAQNTTNLTNTSSNSSSTLNNSKPNHLYSDSEIAKNMKSSQNFSAFVIEYNSMNPFLPYFSLFWNVFGEVNLTASIPYFQNLAIWTFFSLEINFQANLIRINIDNFENDQSSVSYVSSIDASKLYAYQNLLLNIGGASSLVRSSYLSPINYPLNCMVGLLQDATYSLFNFWNNAILYNLYSKVMSDFYFFVIIQPNKWIQNITNYSNLTINKHLSEETFSVSEPTQYFLPEFYFAVTYFFEFTYQDSIFPKNFVLLTNGNLKIILSRKDSENRISILFSNGQNLFIIPSAPISNVNQMTFSLSIVKGNKYQAIINFNSEVIRLNGTMNFIWHQNESFITKMSPELFNLTKFGIAENAADACLKSIMFQTPFQTGDSCFFRSSLNAMNSVCISCQKGFVIFENTCVKFCPIGFYGRNGNCQKCFKPNCKDLLITQFFDVIQIDARTYVIQNLTQLINAQSFGKLLQVSVKGARNGTDYTLKIFSEKESQIIYLVDFLNIAFCFEKSIVFSVTNDDNVYDATGTLIQSNPFQLRLFSNYTNSLNKFGLFATAPPNYSIENSWNPFIEKVMKILANVIFWIFCCSMFLGIIGTTFRCSSCEVNNFFFQKTVQSFLIYYYISFWSIYNSQIPENLNSFLSTLLFSGTFVSRVLGKIYLKVWIKSPSFDPNWHFLSFWRFADNQINNSLVLNLSFPMLMQTLIVLVALIIFLTNTFDKDNANAIEKIIGLKLSSKNNSDCKISEKEDKQLKIDVSHESSVVKNLTENSFVSQKISRDNKETLKEKEFESEISENEIESGDRDDSNDNFKENTKYEGSFAKFKEKMNEGKLIVDIDKYENEEKNTPKNQKTISDVKKIPLLILNTFYTNKRVSTIISLEFLFFFKLIFTFALLFVIESTSYALQNIILQNFKSPIWIISFILSIFYVILPVFLIIYITLISFVFHKKQEDAYFQSKFGFLVEGLDLQSLGSRIFHGMQYLHYFLFSIFLTVGFIQRIAQIIPNLILLTAFFAYTFHGYAKNQFDKIEQLIIHFILLLGKIFLVVIVMDDSFLFLNIQERWKIGFVVIFFACLSIVWNFAIIVYKFFSYWGNCMLIEKHCVSLRSNRIANSFQLDPKTPDSYQEKEMINKESILDEQKRKNIKRIHTEDLRTISDKKIHFYTLNSDQNMFQAEKNEKKKPFDLNQFSSNQNRVIQQGSNAAKQNRKMFIWNEKQADEISGEFKNYEKGAFDANKFEDPDQSNESRLENKKKKNKFIIQETTSIFQGRKKNDLTQNEHESEASSEENSRNIEKPKHVKNLKKDNYVVPKTSQKNNDFKRATGSDLLMGMKKDFSSSGDEPYVSEDEL